MAPSSIPQLALLGVDEHTLTRIHSGYESHAALEDARRNMLDGKMPDGMGARTLLSERFSRHDPLRLSNISLTGVLTLMLGDVDLI